MAITVRHTPYGAVGKLAEAAGRAQQAIREQQYQFRATEQARSIAANLQAQRERIGAEMQMQEERLEQQNIQFGEEMELRTAQVSAQESATHYSYLNNQQQLQQQVEQFEQQMAMKEKAFEITTAMDDRRLQIAEQTSDLAVDRFLADQELRQSNMELWQSLEGEIDPDIYMNGVLAVQAGRLPQLPDPQQTKLMTEGAKQRLDLARKRMHLKQKGIEQERKDRPLEDDAREMYANLAEQFLPSTRTRFMPQTEQSEIDMIVGSYEQYTNAINYGSLGEAQKTEADVIFNTFARETGLNPDLAKSYMESIRNSHWRYTPVSERAETYLQPAGQAAAAAPTSATRTQVSYEPPKGEGQQITTSVVRQYMMQAGQNPALARENARKDGWTGF